MLFYQNRFLEDEVGVYLEGNWTVNVQEIPENTTTPKI
jgi:hypothetical protein